MALAGSGMRRVPPCGRARSFSRTQQRSRFSVPAASAARRGSGWSSGSMWPRGPGPWTGSRSSCRGAGAVPVGEGAEVPAASRRAPHGPAFWRGTVVDSTARGPSGRSCPRCWLVRGPSASGAGVGFTAVFLVRGPGSAGRPGSGPTVRGALRGSHRVGEAVDDRRRLFVGEGERGSSRTTAPWRPPSSTIRPRRRHSCWTAAASTGSGGGTERLSPVSVAVPVGAASGSTSSMPIIRPRPRTSPTLGWSAPSARRRASIRAPSVAAWSASRFSRTYARVAAPAAMASWLPRKVPAWAPGCQVSSSER